jgi:Ca2+-binding EF-hand superfamily protein
MAVMTDARVLPHDTYERMKEIFRAMDNGGKGHLVFEDLRKAYRQGFTAS